MFSTSHGLSFVYGAIFRTIALDCTSTTTNIKVFHSLLSPTSLSLFLYATILLQVLFSVVAVVTMVLYPTGPEVRFWFLHSV